MLAQFQSAMSSVYNGWVLFACIIYSFGAYPSLAMKLTSLRKFGLLRAACWLAILASLYVFSIGVHQAIDWHNPLAGKEAQVAGTVHNAKGGLVILLIMVWPYALMLVGGMIGHLSIRDLLRLRRVT
ncbi:hypothetical protein LJR098_001063 [Rhizobium sp. LjRoot98]|uniref:hypothetical protein n=1 Tax=Rhizobium sp. LjRoot98 TaxID=3342345 RepID=UPI003ED06690